MYSDHNTSGSGRQLRFYCRDCCAAFDAAPDGSGYEQAPCPACGEMCLTVQFEREERERHSNESIVAGWLLGVFGVSYSLPRSAEPPRQLCRETETVTIVRYQRREDAEADAAVLAEREIPARIFGDAPEFANSMDSGRLPLIELQVPAAAASSALAILRAMDAPEPEQNVTDAPLGRISFACEECGAPLSVPASRCGKVEVCDQCGEYVDVPEQLESAPSDSVKETPAGEDLEEVGAWWCPACSEVMQNFGTDVLAVNLCKGCEGIWLDGAELERVFSLNRNWDPTAAIRATTSGTEPIMRCPRCMRTSLENVMYQEHRFQICTGCHGVFIAAATLTRRVRKFSFRRWQKSAKESAIARGAIGSFLELLAAFAGRV